MERRSLYGERGLKYIQCNLLIFILTSLPIRGAWIEIFVMFKIQSAPKSLPIRGAWIEIQSSKGRIIVISCRSLYGERGLKFCLSVILNTLAMSLPIRGAWIEIFTQTYSFHMSNVAPYTGSVD